MICVCETSHDVWNTSEAHSEGLLDPYQLPNSLYVQWGF